MIWKWLLKLRAASFEGSGRAGSFRMLPCLVIWRRVPVILFVVRPSSTSAHSAGVEKERGGGRRGWMCSLYTNVHHPKANPERQRRMASVNLEDKQRQPQDNIRYRLKQERDRNTTRRRSFFTLKTPLVTLQPDMIKSHRIYNFKTISGGILLPTEIPMV